jgi:hypothetical protein
LGTVTANTWNNLDRVTLSWSAPAQPAGGLPVTSYVIEWATTAANFTAGIIAGSVTTGSTATSATVLVNRGPGATTALRNPLTYRFRIRAVNVVSATGGTNSTQLSVTTK